jgi:hypothetical protein
VTRHERNVDDRFECGKPAVHRQAPGARRLAVGVADTLENAVSPANTIVRLVDPVPREIADNDRRDGGKRSAGAGERRRIRQDEPGVTSAKQLGFVTGACRKVCIELGSPREGCAFVEMQAVDLHDAGVDVGRDQGVRHISRLLEQPRGRGRPDDDVDTRAATAERFDDFDLPGGVPETMPGNVEEYGGQASGNRHRQRRGERLFEGADRDELHLLSRVLGKLRQVNFVLMREDHGFDAVPTRSQDLFADPAHR